MHTDAKTWQKPPPPAGGGAQENHLESVGSAASPSSISFSLLSSSPPLPLCSPSFLLFPSPILLPPLLLFPSAPIFPSPPLKPHAAGRGRAGCGRDGWCDVRQHTPRMGWCKRRRAHPRHLSRQLPVEWPEQPSTRPSLLSPSLLILLTLSLHPY